MLTAEQYRAKAANCEGRAAKMADRDLKAQYHDIARQWHELAKRTEAARPVLSNSGPVANRRIL
jgi:hypothetical protein